MEAFGVNHYVPVLFTKAGERDALGEIDEAQKTAFTHCSWYIQSIGISISISQKRQLTSI